jgi:hypothetical protein
MKAIKLGPVILVLLLGTFILNHSPLYPDEVNYLLEYYSNPLRLEEFKNDNSLFDCLFNELPPQLNSINCQQRFDPYYKNRLLYFKEFFVMVSYVENHGGFLPQKIKIQTVSADSDRIHREPFSFSSLSGKSRDSFPGEFCTLWLLVEEFEETMTISSLEISQNSYQETLELRYLLSNSTNKVLKTRRISFTSIGTVSRLGTSEQEVPLNLGSVTHFNAAFYWTESSSDWIRKEPHVLEELSISSLLFF